jgi:hypothetical protein
VDDQLTEEPLAAREWPRDGDSSLPATGVLAVENLFRGEAHAESDTSERATGSACSELVARSDELSVDRSFGAEWATDRRLISAIGLDALSFSLSPAQRTFPVDGDSVQSELGTEFWRVLPPALLTSCEPLPPERLSVERRREELIRDVRAPTLIRRSFPAQPTGKSEASVTGSSFSNWGMLGVTDSSSAVSAGCDALG